MKYISTRGQSVPVSSGTAILRGLADDGGLYMPDKLPMLDMAAIKALCAASYAERAARVLHLFLNDDYSYDELLKDAEAAYSGDRFFGGAAPITALGDRLRVLELWHGPTAAFKDMALQIMPRLLSRALRKKGEKNQALILVATSGDTGKAALEGYSDVSGVKIMVFYPAGGVSDVQKLQMATQTGANVAVQAVVGNFDDTQNGVKRIFGDETMRAELKERGYILSSANSINWGRLVPQIVYYISAYCDLINSGSIAPGGEMDVCVPTGNFGNILAAYIAKKMGLPINRLICASNRNKILTDFFETGIYDRNRHFHMTMSPSMDILISSNLERLLYLSAGADETARYMRELSDIGRYQITPALLETLRRDFTGMWCDESETAAEIKSVWERYNYLCDTHTAVGLHCAEKYTARCGSREMSVCGNRILLAVSTASAYKFAGDVYRSLAGDMGKVKELDALQALSDYTGTPIPAPLDGIAQRKIRFDPNNSIEADKMEDSVLAFAD